MKILVSNNIRVKDCPVKIRAEITKTLTMENPEFIDRLKKKRPLWGVEKYIKCYSIEINGDLILPRGFYSELLQILDKSGVQCEVVENTVKGNNLYLGKWNEKYQLRQYQSDAVFSFLSSSGQGVITAPAGSGKTNMALYAFYSYAVPTLWLTHTKDLMYQTKTRAESLISDIGTVGLLGDSVKDLGSKKLIIATVQTLQRNPDLVDILKDFIGFVVVDEAHHCPSSVFIEVITKFPARYLLGVTATPDRKDQLERLMYLAIGPEVARVDRDQLYRDGALIKPTVNFIYTDYVDQQDGVNVDAGGEDMDYNALLNRLMSDAERKEMIALKILKGWQEHGSTIVLSESIRYCYELKELLEQDCGLLKHKPRIAVIHGTLSKYTWQVAGTEQNAIRAVQSGQAVEYHKKGKKFEIKVQQYTDEEMKNWQMSKKKRLEVVEKLKNREIDIVFATQLAREGLDVPHLSVLHMVTPKRGDMSKDRSDGSAVEQEVGRVMRPDWSNPDKTCVVYDYVDYNVGVFKSQYYSRRRVYERLGVKLPRRKSNVDEIERLLGQIKF